MFDNVEFPTNDGTILRGRLYRPKKASEDALSPIVVLAGGFAAVIEMVVYRYAERIAAGGIAVLAYDHRNFGHSDGSVRQDIDPFQQINDWRDAITFAQTLPGINPDAVGVWGSSYSGGHVLVLGATDRRVKCVVSQVPFISGQETMARQLRPDLLKYTHTLFAQDRQAVAGGNSPQMLPVSVADPTHPAALPTADAYQYMSKHAAEAPSFKNEVTLRSMELAGAYEPGSYVPYITPTPILFIVGLEDQVTVPDVALRAYEKAHHPKELLLQPGGHFDPYEGGFDEAAGAAANWFARHLK